MSKLNLRSYQNTRLLLIIPVILSILFIFAENPQVQESQISENLFICPLETGRITAAYGKMIHPFEKKLVMHTGTDIAAKKGTDVYASGKGEILETGYNKSTGNFIKVAHEANYSTIYYHLDKILVLKEQKIGQGDIIAKVGSTGLSTAPHLHFEIRRNGESVNPEDIIDFTCLKK